MTIIPQGYKETEIGVLPNDWEVSSLATCADKNVKWSITGGPFGSNLKTTDYTDDGIQIIQLQNIGDGYFDNSSIVYTSEEKANQLLSCNIYPGEIILSKMGDPVARACFIPNDANRYLMASDGIRFVNDSKFTNKKYLHDYINSIYFRKRAFEVSNGSTRLRIGLPQLKSLLIPIPPLPEQTAIANALRDIDDLINTTQALIAKKKAIKTATMQQLLTPKEDWVEMKLGERANFFSGGTPLTSIREYYNGNINFITSSELNKTKINEVSNFITSKGLQNSASKLVSEGTVLVALYGATAGVTAITNISGAINQAVLAIIPFSDNSKFIFYLLSNLKTWIINTFIQGGQGNLNANTFKELSLKFPGVDLQNGIVEILESLDLEISTLETTLFKYQSIKQGMMQNLLTGKIRLI